MGQDNTGGARTQGGKPKKLTIARESLRALGDSALARAAGGMTYYPGGGTTSTLCWLGSIIVSHYTEESFNTISWPWCDTSSTCQTMAATCQTCVSQYPCNETITCTCDGYGCLPPVQTDPTY